MKNSFNKDRKNKHACRSHPYNNLNPLIHKHPTVANYPIKTWETLQRRNSLQHGSKTKKRKKKKNKKIEKENPTKIQQTGRKPREQRNLYARVKKRLVNGDIITGSRTNFRPPPRKQQIRRFDSRNRITASSGRALIRNSSAARYSVVAPEIRPVSFRLSRNFHGSLTLANFCKRSGGGAKSWTGARAHAHTHAR